MTLFFERLVQVIVSVSFLLKETLKKAFLIHNLHNKALKKSRICGIRCKFASKMKKSASPVRGLTNETNDK